MCVCVWMISYLMHTRIMRGNEERIGFVLCANFVLITLPLRSFCRVHRFHLNITPVCYSPIRAEEECAGGMDYSILVCYNKLGICSVSYIYFIAH